MLRNALKHFRSRLNYRYLYELLEGPNIWLCPKCVKILSKRNSVSEELARIDGEIIAKCEALIVHGVRSGNVTSLMATSESSSISVSSASAAPVLLIRPEPSYLYQCYQLQLLYLCHRLQLFLCCQFNLKLLHLYQCYQLQLLYLSSASAAPVLSIRPELLQCYQLQLVLCHLLHQNQ